MTSTTKKTLDDVFSLYIRTKHSENGSCRCYICDKPFPILRIQNGHCLERGDNGVRWNENNCRPQCESCNCYHNTTDIFRSKLREEIGEEAFSELERLSKATVQISEAEAKDMIRKFRHKLKDLE